MAVTVAGLLREGSACLAGAEARFEAEQLLMHALGRDRAWLFAHADAQPDGGQCEHYRRLLARRAAGEPVAYLIGRRGFWTLDLEVGPAVLIPRPETELLVEAALEAMRGLAAPDVLDLGCGSGAIALALAAARPDARVSATDTSTEALQVAAANARRLRLESIEFLHGSWFAPLRQRRFQLIVSNPPYLAEDDPHLQRGDLPHEPRAALVAGADGLAALRAISTAAPAHLLPGAWLLLEHGAAQGADVRSLMLGSGFEAVTTLRDIESRERVTRGRLPE